MNKVQSDKLATSVTDRRMVWVCEILGKKAKMLEIIAHIAADHIWKTEDVAMDLAAMCDIRAIAIVDLCERPHAKDRSRQAERKLSARTAV